MNDDFRWYLLQKKRTEGLILNAVRIFRRQGVEPIVIKGWAAARNYPDGVPRLSADIDMAVAGADYPAARDIVLDRSSGVLGVDLHRELRHLDTLPWAELLNNSEVVELDGEGIRVLSAEDHLRVLCVHWLTDGGINRDRLWDIFYAVQNRPAGFDWGACLDVTPEHRRGWIIATIGLAHKYLALKIDDLPFTEEATRLPAWLTNFLEKELQTEHRLWPLDASVGDSRAFLRQVIKRFPPNPVQATINCEGHFDDGSRIRYQIRDFFSRLRPSIKRVIPAVRGK